MNATHRVILTSPFWSGLRITTTMEQIPVLGQKIKPWAFTPNPNAVKQAAEYIVCGRRRENICSHCLSRVKTGDAEEWVIDLADERDSQNPTLQQDWKRNWKD